MTNLNDVRGAGKLTEADLDAAIRYSWPPRRIAQDLPACVGGPCDQGHKPCPSPTT